MGNREWYRGQATNYLKRAKKSPTHSLGRHNVHRKLSVQISVLRFSLENYLTKFAEISSLHFMEQKNITFTYPIEARIIHMKIIE